MTLNKENRRKNLRSVFEGCDFKLKDAKEKADEYENDNSTTLYFYWGQGKDGVNLAIDPRVSYDTLLDIPGVTLQTTKQRDGIRFGTAMSKFPSKYEELNPGDPRSLVGRMFKVQESSLPDLLKQLAIISQRSSVSTTHSEPDAQKSELQDIAVLNHRSDEVEAAPNAPVPAEYDGSGSTGYQDDPAKKKCTEEYAVKRATAHYQKQGFSVIEKGKPYDLLCTNGELIIHAEVKGTTGSADKVILTRNEVTDARDNSWRSDLFIVRNIILEPSGDTWLPSGGEHIVFENWEPDDRDLVPSQFDYKVPRNP